MRTEQVESGSHRRCLARATLSGALGLALLAGLLLAVGAFGSAAQGPLPPEVEPARWPEGADAERLLDAVRAAAPAPPVAAQATVTLCVDASDPGCYTRIQDAIDGATPGTLIEVAAGTYPEHITMTDGVSIYGAGWDSSTGTVIDGGHSEARPVVHVPWDVSASTVLSGVQVTRGGVISPTGRPNGGGLAIDGAARIVNTWVNNSYGYYGGGVYVGSGGRPTLENVPVWFCEALYGGGFHLASGAVVTITGNPLDPANGTVLWNSATAQGGGLYTAGAEGTVLGLQVYWNSAPSGGGVYIAGAGPQASFLLNDIGWNSADRGGGLAADVASGLDVGLNVIRGNTAGNYGGGAYLNQAAGLFQLNWLSDNWSGGWGGGGVHVLGDSPALTVQNNWFEGNSATQGGGLCVSSGAGLAVDANTMVTNTANLGGGIYLYQASAVTITNNIVARNVASGTVGGGVVLVESPAQLINNTIADNTGDGVWFSAADGAVMVNNILSGNSGHGLERDPMTTTVGYTADYNDFYGNVAGARSGVPAGGHDRSLNPAYVAPASLDYHIQASSPVSTTGSTLWAPARDMDGELRRTRGTVSMGADEIPGPVRLLYLPLVLRNGP